MIAENLITTKNSMKEACLKARRNYEEVQLIAVSKNKTKEDIMEAYELGQKIFGENRVQELINKIPVLPQDIQWHLIGHLQTNKVKYIISKVAMIHSLDSLKLAQEINKRAEQIGREIPVLVQVNIAEEESKFGLCKSEILNFLETIKDFKFIKVQGLMTIAPEVEDPEAVRYVFKELSILFNNIKKLKMPNVEMIHLSMGMTGDYKVAIEEGATLVRIGSGIFGSRQY